MLKLCPARVARRHTGAVLPRRPRTRIRMRMKGFAAARRLVWHAAPLAAGLLALAAPAASPSLPIPALGELAGGGRAPAVRSLTPLFPGQVAWSDAMDRHDLI